MAGESTEGSLAMRHGNTPAMEPFPCPPRAAAASLGFASASAATAVPIAGEPARHSWAAAPPRRFRGARWRGEPGEAMPPPAHAPWLPAPAGIIKCAPVEHVLRLATGMWADLTYKPQQPGCNFQTGPVRSVFQLKIY